MKNVIGGLLLLTVASSALAGERITEVWNPPEARLTCGTKPHTCPAHHYVSARTGLPKRHQVLAAPSDKVETRDLPVEAGKHEPNFDEIPRQLTPEGNVLRVTGGAIHASVKR
ncbi:hypothetical protein [Paraburkholderia steynii]|uniref:hypothetical protein n=1 Tax=Paraburkholderia steynii TaxID=1245441 RepID=UPI00115F86D1|nr:hypothetical protein [Paraburkholderia steynii]